MAKKYANSPIVEAVCEFRLIEDTKWDLTIPGLFYERIREEFPIKEKRLIQEININQTDRGVEQQLRTSERVLFFANDRKTFIQLGAHLLAINCLSPYPTWAGFKPKIERAFKALGETLEIGELQRIGLRYINRIEVPGQREDSEQVNLDDLFEFRPFLGPSLPQNMTSFIVMCSLPFHDERDSCRVQLTNAVPKTPKDIGFMLDLDYYLSQPKAISAQEAIAWVEMAHRGLENTFEACITDGLRAIFKEVK